LEAIGFNDVGARLELGAMYVEHDIGARKDPILVAAFERSAAEIVSR